MASFLGILAEAAGEPFAAGQLSILPPKSAAEVVRPERMHTAEPVLGRERSRIALAGPEAPRTGESGGMLVVERPPAGLARGKYPASAWLIGLLGGLALLSVTVYFVVRSRRK
jgi:hypothetical protein